MSEFVRVCQVSDVPEPGKRIFEVGEDFIVLFHVNGKFYALDDCCSHDGGPLGEGLLDEFTIICPRHGAQFDIRTGEALTMPAVRPTRSHEVRVDGENVLVKLSDA